MLESKLQNPWGLILLIFQAPPYWGLGFQDSATVRSVGISGSRVCGL